MQAYRVMEKRLERSPPITSPDTACLYPWVASAREAVVWLRKDNWTTEADEIDLVLSELPTGLLDERHPEITDRRLDVIRAVAERIRTILTTCLAGSTPPTAKTEQGEGTGGTDSPPGQPEINCGADRETILRSLEPADRKAYLSFQYAESKAERRLQDREAYQLLEDEGIPTDRGDLGELTGYDWPAQETWTRQLRNARNALGEQKYTPRKGRPTGRSIVAGRDIESQRGSDE